MLGSLINFFSKEKKITMKKLVTYQSDTNCVTNI